jgi:soluble lytic murein transglycosylase-like protein
MAVPRLLSDLPLAPCRAPLVPATATCGLSLPCAPLGRADWQRLVQAQLATRIPGLSDSDRVRLSEAILDEAGLAELEPLFVLAVIEVESGYDPDARSDRGARGLMQLRPSTLRGEVARSGLRGDDPDDPALNVRAGVRYLRRLLDTFDSRDLALMAYNAGPARIGGHLKTGGVPERFRAYPRRVRDEERRLRRALSIEPPAALAANDAPPAN